MLLDNFNDYCMYKAAVLLRVMSDVQQKGKKTLSFRENYLYLPSSIEQILQGMSIEALEKALREADGTKKYAKLRNTTSKEIRDSFVKKEKLETEQEIVDHINTFIDTLIPYFLQEEEAHDRLHELERRHAAIDKNIELRYQIDDIFDHVRCP